MVAQGGCEEEEVKSKVVAYSFMSEISCFYLGSVWLLGEYSLRSRQIRSSFRSVSPPGVVEWGGGLCYVCGVLKFIHKCFIRVLIFYVLELQSSISSYS